MQLPTPACLRIPKLHAVGVGVFVSMRLTRSHAMQRMGVGLSKRGREVRPSGGLRLRLPDRPQG